MSWYEAEHVEPVWYVDMLVARVRADLEAGADVGGEWQEPAAAPDTLESWR